MRTVIVDLNYVIERKASYNDNKGITQLHRRKDTHCFGKVKVIS